MKKNKINGQKLNMKYINSIVTDCTRNKMIKTKYQFSVIINKFIKPNKSNQGIKLEKYKSPISVGKKTTTGRSKFQLCEEV